MSAWEAILLGFVEGLTEYLPVSSTAHLLVVGSLLGLAGATANAFVIAIQAGAILAVPTIYPGRVLGILSGLVGRNAEGARLALNIAVAFLPAAVFGLLFDDAIEAWLFGPWPIVVAWVVGGVVILAVGKRVRQAGGLAMDSLSWRAALTIGFFQCLALWPGTSRSLATLIGGLVLGLSLTAAVEFSFLLGLVTLGAATSLKVVQHGSTMWSEYGPVALGLGLLTAWVTAALTVRWMVGWLEHRGLAVFAWWRFGAALLVALLVLTGRW